MDSQKDTILGGHILNPFLFEALIWNYLGTLACPRENPGIYELVLGHHECSLS
jgi:hypothetical protein